MEEKHSMASCLDDHQCIQRIHTQPSWSIESSYTDTAPAQSLQHHSIVSRIMHLHCVIAARDMNVTLHIHTYALRKRINIEIPHIESSVTTRDFFARHLSFQSTSTRLRRVQDEVCCLCYLFRDNPLTKKKKQLQKNIQINHQPSTINHQPSIHQLQINHSFVINRSPSTDL